MRRPAIASISKPQIKEGRRLLAAVDNDIFRQHDTQNPSRQMSELIWWLVQHADELIDAADSHTCDAAVQRMAQKLDDFAIDVMKAAAGGRDGYTYSEYSAEAKIEIAKFRVAQFLELAQKNQVRSQRERDAAYALISEIRALATVKRLKDRASE
jgi:hypothetical protein